MDLIGVKQIVNAVKLDIMAKAEVEHAINDILCDEQLPTHRKLDKIMEVIYSIISK